MIYYLYTTFENDYPCLVSKDGFSDGNVYKSFEASSYIEALSRCPEIYNYANKHDCVTAFVIRPLEEPVFTVIKPEKRHMGKIVNGCIEYKVPNDFPTITIICNDEGKLMNEQLNRGLYCQGVMYDIIAGTFIVAFVNKTGEFDDIQNILANEVYEYFKEPEVFLFDRKNDEIVTIKCSNKIARIMKDNNISIIS